MDSTTVVSWSQFGQDKINEFIGAIKDIAPEAWKILVKQMVVDATVTIWGFGIFWFVAIIGLSISLPLVKRNLNSSADFHISYGFAGAFVLATIFGIVGTLTRLPNAIKMLNNPEYYAIAKIMGW